MTDPHYAAAYQIAHRPGKRPPTTEEVAERIKAMMKQDEFNHKWIYSDNGTDSDGILSPGGEEWYCLDSPGDVVELIALLNRYEELEEIAERFNHWFVRQGHPSSGPWPLNLLNDYAAWKSPAKGEEE